MRITILCLAALLALSACGMNRAVGVLPNTLDDLERRTQGEEPASERAP
ncbi:hypothetical protein [Aureimonas mangrovi]|nr:hypothetical protein [Aureimonas mangrovi]